MTYKKVRAGISAILLYAQLLLFFFVVDVSIVKDSAISSLKAITLPLALQEIALLMILTAAVFIGYYVFPMAKWRKIYICSIGAIEIFFWLCSVVTMGIKKVLGVTEILFMILMCVLIAAGCAAAVFLSPKNDASCRGIAVYGEHVRLRGDRGYAISQRADHDMDRHLDVWPLCGQHASVLVVLRQD